MGSSVLAAGLLGRVVSNRAQSTNAKIAKALAVTGGKMPKGKGSEAVKRKIAEILAAASARSGEIAGLD